MMSTADTDVKSEQFLVIPEHWSLFLRCTICFGYLHEPHTLSCGHTFCRGCLQRLAEIARDDNPDVRMRHIRLNCPTCRHPFSARPIMSDRPGTSIVLKQLVDLWRRECSLLASTSALTVRSVATQTRVDSPGGELNEVQQSESVGDFLEEFTVRMRPLDEYCQAVMHRVSESMEDMEQDMQDALLCKAGDGGPLAGSGSMGTGNSDSETDSSTHSSSSRGGRGSRSSLSNVSIPDLFSRGSLLLPQFDSLPPARLLLLLVWCMYSVVIVGLAQSFLPYVILFTLFFFLVVLR